MFLNDIGNSPNSTFKKINQHLEINYGFKISKSIGEQDLISLVEQIEGEVNELKLQGDSSHCSPEISKRLLILEGIKSLKESSMFLFQSPDLERIISALADYVHDHFSISGTCEDDFNHSVKDAMNHYRSSKYRFPDDLVETRVRECALDRLRPQSSVILPMVDEEEVDEADRNPYPLHNNSYIKRPTSGMSDLDTITDTDDGEEVVPMIRDSRTGQMVPDIFAIHAAKLRKGIVYESDNKGTKMKEQQNLVKNLRRILETQVSQAAVITSSKNFADELQEMIEKIGRLQNEDLPPVTDQMRETYGTESSSAFQTEIYGALQGVMDSLYTAKSQVDDSVTRMAETGQFTSSIDMEKDIEVPPEGGMDDNEGMPNELGAEEPTDDVEMEQPEPLGRSKKLESLQAQIHEMRKLVEKARRLKRTI
jgi:uncharacterized protein (UPF0335 family)